MLLQIGRQDCEIGRHARTIHEREDFVRNLGALALVREEFSDLASLSSRSEEDLWVELVQSPQMEPLVALRIALFLVLRSLSVHTNEDVALLLTLLVCLLLVTLGISFFEFLHLHNPRGILLYILHRHFLHLCSQRLVDDRRFADDGADW